MAIFPFQFKYRNVRMDFLIVCSGGVFAQTHTGDGADRSNGHERGVFERGNHGMASKEEAHLYSVSDM